MKRLQEGGETGLSRRTVLIAGAVTGALSACGRNDGRARTRHGLTRP